MSHLIWVMGTETTSSAGAVCTSNCGATHLSSPHLRGIEINSESCQFLQDLASLLLLSPFPSLPSPCLLCFCLYLLLSHSSIPDSPLSFFSFLSVNFLSFESLSIPSEGRWARPGGTGVHKYSTISCLCCGVSGMSLRPVPRRNQTKM